MGLAKSINRDDIARSSTTDHISEHLVVNRLQATDVNEQECIRRRRLYLARVLVDLRFVCGTVTTEYILLNIC